jgi:hypothetical protein
MIAALPDLRYRDRNRIGADSGPAAWRGNRTSNSYRRLDSPLFLPPASRRARPDDTRQLRTAIMAF